MIIGLSGYARSGKDTVANYLVARHGFTKVAFADSLRDAVYRLNPYVKSEGDDFIRYADALDIWGYEEAKERYPEIRRLLQVMGTEVGRELWGEDFWVERLGERIQHLSLVHQLSGRGSGRFVIPDCRFESEAKAVTDRWGGVVWRIERPGFGPVNGHASETGLDGWRFDAHLLNDKTPAALCEAVDRLLEPV